MSTNFFIFSSSSPSLQNMSLLPSSLIHLQKLCALNTYTFKLMYFQAPFFQFPISECSNPAWLFSVFLYLVWTLWDTIALSFCQKSSFLTLHFHMGMIAGATDFRCLLPHSNEMGVCSILFSGYMVDIIVLYGEFIVILFVALDLYGYWKICRKIQFRYLSLSSKSPHSIASIDKCWYINC